MQVLITCFDNDRNSIGVPQQRPAKPSQCDFSLHYLISKDLAATIWSACCASCKSAGCLGGGGFLFGPPAEDGLARRGSFVEAADACGVRRGEDEVGRVLRFAGDGAHGVDELL